MKNKKKGETIEVTCPELNIARTSVLDYFHDLNIDVNREIFCWNHAQLPEPASMSFCGAVCRSMGFLNKQKTKK